MSWRFTNQLGLDRQDAARLAPRRARSQGPLAPVSYRQWVGLLCLLGVGGCDNLERFDTGDDEAYCGEIIAAPFTRAGFPRRLRLQLQLDLASLHATPGRLTSDDSESGPCQPQPLFDDAALRFPEKLETDALSTLQFGQSREHNFLGWVASSCRGTYLAVVSLMHDGNVEVRLMKGDLEAQAGASGEAFGVFPLRRYASRCAF